MSEETIDKEKATKPWQWPNEWARDEKFWRDVATRTASGLLTLFLAYNFAVIAGYLKQPAWLRSIAAVVWVLFFLWLTAFIVQNGRRGWTPNAQPTRRLSGEGVPHSVARYSLG